MGSRGSHTAGGRKKRMIGKKVRHAEAAYCQNTNPAIRIIIPQLEEEAIQAQSRSKMEDWEYLLPYPGNTRGRMNLYKQSLHIYWVMKRLLAKSMEQIAMEMAELSQGIPNLREELRKIQVTLYMHDKTMDAI